MKQDGFLHRFCRSALASPRWVFFSANLQPRREPMADGPTVVQTGGSGGTIAAVIIAIVAVVVLLFMFGVIDLGGGGSSDVNVNVDVPKVDAPAPEAPAPAAPTPATGG
jgi:hypothetical protein